jgi:hypothetical protein
MPGVETTSISRVAGREVSVEEAKPFVRDALERAFNIHFVAESPVVPERSSGHPPSPVVSERSSGHPPSPVVPERSSGITEAK